MTLKKVFNFFACKLYDAYIRFLSTFSKALIIGCIINGNEYIQDAITKAGKVKSKDISNVSRKEPKKESLEKKINK